MTTSGEPLLQALKAVFRPLARLLIARGVALPTIVAALKEVLVEVSSREFPIGGRAPSDSRVSLLTGVHRKDVRAIRERGAPLSTPPPAGLAATVIGRWLAGRETTDAEGLPRALARQSVSDNPSFEALAASVSTDVRPRTILNELLRLGLVQVDAEDRIHLLADGYLPVDGGAEAIGFFGRNLEDHMAAGVANLLAGPGDRRFLERAVYYNGLTPADVDLLEAEARTLSMAALRHLNGLALERQEAARSVDGARERFRFGVFFWRAPTSANAPVDGKPG